MDLCRRLATWRRLDAPSRYNLVPNTPPEETRYLVHRHHPPHCSHRHMHHGENWGGWQSIPKPQHSTPPSLVVTRSSAKIILRPLPEYDFLNSHNDQQTRLSPCTHKYQPASSPGNLFGCSWGRSLLQSIFGACKHGLDWLEGGNGATFTGAIIVQKSDGSLGEEGLYTTFHPLYFTTASTEIWGVCFPCDYFSSYPRRLDLLRTNHTALPGSSDFLKFFSCFFFFS